jgi:hypothetical protein
VGSATARMNDGKEFARLKARLRDAILHDPRLTRAEQRVGYEIADHLNARSGDAWPPQDYLARRTGYSVKSVERATKRLAGTWQSEGLWFSREIDGRAYRYVPKFDQLDRVGEGADTRQNVGYRHPTFGTKTPDICDRNTRQNVGLSSLREPNKDYPAGAGGQVSARPPADSNQTDERGRKGAIPFDDVDAESTARAAGGGAPRFVFEGSEPWRAWTEYRETNGIPGSLPTRRHMVDGRWRTGWDAPTLWPPGYGRVRSQRKS